VFRNSFQTVCAYEKAGAFWKRASSPRFCRVASLGLAAWFFFKESILQPKRISMDFQKHEGATGDFLARRCCSFSRRVFVVWSSNSETRDRDGTHRGGGNSWKKPHFLTQMSKLSCHPCGRRRTATPGAGAGTHQASRINQLGTHNRTEDSFPSFVHDATRDASRTRHQVCWETILR